MQKDESGITDMRPGPKVTSLDDHMFCETCTGSEWDERHHWHAWGLARRHKRHMIYATCSIMHKYKSDITDIPDGTSLKTNWSERHALTCRKMRVTSEAYGDVTKDIRSARHAPTRKNDITGMPEVCKITSLKDRMSCTHVCSSSGRQERTLHLAFYHSSCANPGLARGLIIHGRL
jgi:hypothetical protein